MVCPDLVQSQIPALLVLTKIIHWGNAYNSHIISSETALSEHKHTQRFQDWRDMSGIPCTHTEQRISNDELAWKVLRDDSAIFQGEWKGVWIYNMPQWKPSPVTFAELYKSCLWQGGYSLKVASCFRITVSFVTEMWISSRGIPRTSVFLWKT